MALSGFLCLSLASRPTQPKNVGSQPFFHVLLTCLSLALTLSAIPRLCHAQQPQSNPQAVSLASQAIGALTSGNSLSDLTFTGSATWYGHSTPTTGALTLLALGIAESRINVAATGGTWSEIRDGSTGAALGEWISPSGASGYFSPQNCATDAVWFYPGLSSLTGSGSIVLLYIGLENRNGEAVQHLQSYVYQPPSQNGSQSNPNYQQLSTQDWYLDASSLLPVAIVFNSHPDNTAQINLLIEVDFSAYQAMSGFLVPTRVQKVMQGNLLLDMTITGAFFNTGLPLSDFTIN